MSLVFGVYPFGVAGGPDGLVVGPPDDLGRIGAALAELAGAGPPLLVRLPVAYTGDVDAALAQVGQFAQIGSLVDLSLNFHDLDGDVSRWCAFVDTVVRRHGRQVSAIGITNEANLHDIPYAPDGAYPHAQQALVEGVLTAAEAKRATGATAALGFTAASDTGPQAGAFWRQIRETGGAGFAAAVDFAALTMYPGGFSPSVPSTAEIVAQTTGMLEVYRAQLAVAGIADSVPIRIGECGWPTGPGRGEDDQARILEAVLATVIKLAGELNVTHWELFALRDADSGGDDVFGRFGVLRDDYTPKAAFAVVCAAIQSAT